MNTPTYNEKSSDEMLREGCLQQHRLAQELLYRRYFERLMPIPLRYFGNRNEAVEVLNQAFLKIFHNMANYSGSGAFGGWMASIVTHTTIDFARRKNVYHRNLSFGDFSDQPIQNSAVDHIAAEELLALIQQLPDNQRTVFNLYVIDGYKHREIAELLQIDESTSKWHLAEARRLLQKKLSKTFKLPAFFLL
ncbi:MAG: RNA polymerase sigma factor [Chitinophagales bacterium]|nr:RNA polymerase sigma factor [Chitinophagales bacterium]